MTLPSHETIALILGAISSVFLIIAALSVKRNKLLIFAVLCSIFAVAQFLYLGETLAAAIIGVSIARNLTILLAINSPKFAWLDHWGTIVTAMVASTVIWVLLMDWKNFEIPLAVLLFGSLNSSLAVLFKNLIYTKITLLVGSIAWIVYQISSQAWGMLAGEVFNFAGNAIALVLLLKAAATGKEVFDPAERLTDAITSAIPVITTNIKTTLTSTIPVITKAIPIITSPVNTIEDVRRQQPGVETGEFPSPGEPEDKGH